MAATADVDGVDGAAPGSRSLELPALRLFPVGVGVPVLPAGGTEACVIGLGCSPVTSGDVSDGCLLNVRESSW